MFREVTLLSVFSIAAFSYGFAASKEEPPSRSSTYGAFHRGETLSWDQLQVVADDVGMNPQRLREMQLKDRLTRLIQKYRLPLEIGGFAGQMKADEEFRIYKGKTSGRALLQMNSEFWKTNDVLAENEAFLLYLLFRANAYYVYRDRYDAEHCTWLLQEAEPLAGSFEVLRAALDQSDVEGNRHQVPPTPRDVEFRRSIDPTGDPNRTLRALIEYALRAVAQRASDGWAVQQYRARVGSLPSVVEDAVRRRGRALAADFGQARFAMTLQERMTFHRLLKTPFRYRQEK